MVRIVQNPDGTRTFYIDQDRLDAASFLDDDDSPELTDEQFDELTDEMRKVREDEDERTGESDG